MKFKRIEVSGFKSFADKLTIKFGSGITGIVGPNGCGKSNVADAVRWVLGEQSAKLLRGSSMQDVIFNGTEQRKSLSFCEVALYFNNIEDENGIRLFPSLDFNEVVISRKLYRSGESEYLLNKQVCRLKDITGLLHDGNMGREGYSIIGQGRIDELLSAKPEDRRAIFEEAAGIAKFKVKKVESERKLGRTSENLVRITDILDEKAKQLDPLTRQSEAARKWLSYRDRLKHHEINLYIHQYDTANEAKAFISQRLSGVIEELELKNRESEKTAAEYNEAMSGLHNADRSIEVLREELLELTVGIEKQAGEVKLLNERLGYLNAQSERLSDENKKAQSEHAALLSFIEEGKAAAEARLEELTQKRTEAEQLSAQYIAVVEELVRGEGESDKRHREIFEAMDKLAEIKSNTGRLLAEKEGLISSIDDLKKRIEFYNAKLDTDNAEAARLKSDIDARDAQKKELSLQREALRTEQTEAADAVHECAKKLDKLAAEFHTHKTRRKMFAEMQEANESFAFSVKKLLSDAKENKTLAAKFEGVVAALIKVQTGYETAVETALGNAVQHMITKNEEDAKFLISYLKDKRYGRVTFLPITSVKPRHIDAQYAPLLKEDGCLGPALDFISFDARYASVMRGLLGGTVFTRDMDAAVKIAKKSGYGFKIVTLDGDVIQSSGSITGGSKKSELTNVFGYEREIEALDKHIALLENQTAAATSLREEKAAIGAQHTKKLADLSELIHAIDIDTAAKRTAFDALDNAVCAAKDSAASLELELANAQKRIEIIDKDLNSVTELENIVSSERLEASETNIELKQKFEALRSERDGLHERMLNAKMTVSTLENDVKNYEADTRRLQDNALTLAERIEYNHSQLIENKDIIQRIERELNVFSTDAKESDSDRVKEIRHTLADLDAFKQKIQAKLSEMEERRGAVLEEIQKIHERKTKEEMLLLKVDSDIEYMQNRVAEEYELSYEACLKFKEDGYDTNEGSREAGVLKRQMQALGHVNLEAIEQCKQVYESYHELDVQKQDLLNAKADLEKIIADLSKEMLSRFTQHFETIRKNFIKTFRELFDGGTADLLLLENENPLEAGIEIVAQPPEKKLQTISLLSGGERALTAIAILFSILKLRPMPFCVLDEIEAALDDANATRFAKYLRRFAVGTQFIVITHRKPTMELADSLYGVTMEEKGVSKIVSVKLSEAVAAAETA
ncbi:MAG: chromosome segregation protein SMC [Firmicutes bacterium]|nr:chromosome segregation protein SMC [Bacillota bacterium]